MFKLLSPLQLDHGKQCEAKKLDWFQKLLPLCCLIQSARELISFNNNKNKCPLQSSLSVVVVGVVDEGGDEGPLEDASSQQQAALYQLLPLDVRVVKITWNSNIQCFEVRQFVNTHKSELIDTQCIAMANANSPRLLLSINDQIRLFFCNYSRLQ